MNGATAASNSGEAPASPMLTPRFRVGFATDIGQKRSQNQDNLSIHPDLGLFIVADGMGGHQGGETASLMATQIIPQVVRNSQQGSSDWDARALIARAIESANNAIHNRALQASHLHGMGTTTTALLFKDHQLYIGQVGDSRCYYFRDLARLSEGGGLGTESERDYALWQLTRDHSLVQEKLRAGLITRDEIKTDRMKNVITRSVGFEREINVETYHFSPRPGDLFLICSDGLSGLITDSEMLAIVQQHLGHTQTQSGLEIDRAVEHLIRKANENGGDDNITAVLIEVL